MVTGPPALTRTRLRSVDGNGKVCGVEHIALFALLGLGGGSLIAGIALGVSP